jgi:hypothetical protein
MHMLASLSYTNGRPLQHSSVLPVSPGVVLISSLNSKTLTTSVGAVTLFKYAKVSAGVLLGVFGAKHVNTGAGFSVLSEDFG